MKTVKTANGIRKIEDWNMNLVPLQLRTILQEHRATLVDKLMNGGLSAYIDYKFATRATPKQHDQISAALSTLRNEGIDISTYGSIFAAVEKNEFTNLDNALRLMRPLKPRCFNRGFSRTHNYFFNDGI